MSENILNLVRRDLEAACAARKCHACGCFHSALRALEASALRAPLASVLERARDSSGAARYDCLGCEVCWPADALARAGQISELPAGAGCPTDTPQRRAGWPPYPGEYRALRHAAPVAVCTVHSRELVDALAEVAPAGLSIVGALHTENLGIERIVENVVANPNIRVLLVCGHDTSGRVGHFPGQSLVSLLEHGTDEHGRIAGADGRRPVLKNVEASIVKHFRKQVRVVDERELVDVAAIAARVEAEARSASGPVEAPPEVARAVRTLKAAPAEQLVLDEAGYVVIVPERRRGLLVAEHYDNRGVLGTVVEGQTGAEVVATLLRERLVTRADHAAYLGRELALAEQALRDGTRYVQDAAPGDTAASSARAGDHAGLGDTLASSTPSPAKDSDAKRSGACGCSTKGCC